LSQDLGQPSSYLSLEAGASVFSCDGEPVGKVEHVLADEDADIFDGLVLDTSVLPGGHRFVDADQVEEIFERGVLLKLDRAAADSLPEPSENPAALEADPGEEPEGPLEGKLRRAWELISGKG
jgi:PRC-barrel domain